MPLTVLGTVAAGATALTALLFGCSTASTSASAVIAAAPAYVASVGNSGAVSIRRADSDKEIVSVRPALFETTWQLRSASFRKESGTSVIAASNAGSTVAVETRVETDGERLRFRYTLTPDKDVSVNSVHVSVSAPATLFVGGAAGIGDANTGSIEIPSSAKDVNLASGSLGSVRLDKGDLRLRVNSDSNLPVMIQDNRTFSGSDLEIRVGTQSGEGRIWKAGQAEVFAFTLTLPGAVSIEKEEPITLKAGADWLPLPLQLDILPGSALDFSGMLQDAPAGKYGRVVGRQDGHFGFEKRNRAQRFYGVNLCFSANYLNHEEADRLAERFARIGYNTVRIHHYEGDLIDQNAPNSLTFRKDNLDKLDYLVAALKKRGLYIKTDLFVSRPVKPAEMGLESGGMDEFKSAVLVSRPAMENWKAFSRALLTHVNPYTNMAWKDDPAIAWISVINEPNLTNHFGRFNGKLRELLDTEWKSWLRTRYGTDEKVRVAWSEPTASLTTELPRSIEKNARGRDVAAFLTTLHRRGFAEMKRFLREEVKTAALLTDLNGWSETPEFMAARADLDWVDNHFYWDHPQFLERDWQLPSQGGSGGLGAVETGGAGPNFHAMTRLFGKPFSISEYNYSSPNRYRAEGGLIMGAASALQDWDAVWRFAYSHSRDSVLTPQPLNYFDMAVDPAGQAGERAALLLFLRGDVRVAPQAVSRLMSEETLLERPGEKPAEGFGDLALVTRIGTRVASKGTTVKVGKGETGVTAGSSTDVLMSLKSADKLSASNRTDFAATIRESGTGEVFVDGEKGVLRVVTARTVGGVAAVGGAVEAGPLSAVVKDTRAAVWASALDGKSVADSGRLLLVHLTDVQNSNMRYSTPNRRVLEDWGGLPHLARRGSATITLAHRSPDRLKAWRLDTSGRRVAPLPVKVDGKQVILELTTEGPNGATLYYEVATE